MAEPFTLQQIVPILRRGELVGLQIARVVHDAVARKRLTLVEALRIVDRIVADLCRDRLVVDVGCATSKLSRFSTSNASGADAQNTSGRCPAAVSRTNAMPATVLLFRISILMSGFAFSNAALYAEVSSFGKDVITVTVPA